MGIGYAISDAGVGLSVCVKERRESLRESFFFVQRIESEFVVICQFTLDIIFGE